MSEFELDFLENTDLVIMITDKMIAAGSCEIPADGEWDSEEDVAVRVFTAMVLASGIAQLRPKPHRRSRRKSALLAQQSP